MSRLPLAPTPHHGSSHRLPCPFFRPLRFRHRGDLLDLRVRERSDGMLEVDAGAVLQQLRPAQAVSVQLQDGRWHVQADGSDLFISDATFEAPTSTGSAGAARELRAPFNGRVIAVSVAPGNSVAHGAPLLVIESMKLENVIAAVRTGTVTGVHVEPGQQVTTGQILVTFDASE